MYGAARYFFPVFNDSPVDIHPIVSLSAIFRQEGGMNIDDSSTVSPNHTVRYFPQVSGKYNQAWVERSQQIEKFFFRSGIFSINNIGGNIVLFCTINSAGAGGVGNQPCDPGIKPAGFNGVNHGLKIRTRSGCEKNKVVHDGEFNAVSAERKDRKKPVDYSGSFLEV